MQDRRTLPDDEWTYDTPLTKEELADLRTDLMRNQTERLGPFMFETLTCDECVRAPVCACVFDWYNTDGDCLWEK